jgi:hypothetical protein
MLNGMPRVWSYGNIWRCTEEEGSDVRIWEWEFDQFY